MPMPQSTIRRLLVAIETDPARRRGLTSTRPRLLATNESEQLLAHLATDLANLMPEIVRCRLVAVGALFDLTQVLRPGYPVFKALEKLLTNSDDHLDQSGISLGATRGRIPVADLQPEEDIPLGLLQLLPVVVSGPADLLDELGTTMEHRLMERGQVSPHTAKWLENAFDIRTSHARFMTLLDLSAMFRLQLEHFGFLPLWELLNAALIDLEDEVVVRLEHGHQFNWRNGAVHTMFQTFDYWSNSGSGKTMDSIRGMLAGGYADWTRTLRQFLTTLEAHAVPLEIQAPPDPPCLQRPTYLVEDTAQAPDSRCAEVTEHSFGELGTICVTVVIDGKQQNYYPLAPQGLNDIHAAIRSRGLDGRTIAFPGCILYDENRRCLVPEPGVGPVRH